MKVTRNVYISRHSCGFDQSNPEGSNQECLHLMSGGDDDWTKHGYTRVGTAQIEIEFLNQTEMTTNAVSALRKQKESVLAEAQAEATRIEGEIQNLLAITHEQ